MKTLFLTTSILLFFFLIGQPAISSGQVLIFIGQKHSVGDSAIESIKNEGVASQLAILNFLLENSNGLIFLEGVTSEISLEEYQKRNSSKFIRMVFSRNTMPKLTEELTTVQKELLYSKGAAHIMLALGLVEKILPASDAQVDKKVSRMLNEFSEKYPSTTEIYELFELEPNFHKLVFDHREQIALQFMKTHLETTKENDKPIYLIFGSDHKFEKYTLLGKTIKRLDLEVPLSCKNILSP